MNRANHLLWLGAALVLSGCFGGGKNPGEPTTPAPANLPPGCDAHRPAVAHRAAGIPLEPQPDVRVYPCLLPTGVPSGEPTLGVHPETGAVFFYPAYNPTGPIRNVGVAVTTDEGATWTRLVPNVADAGPTHPTSLDPYFYLDPDTGRLFADDLLTVNCSILSFSDDEGDTWTNTVVGCTEFDHQNLFAGKPRTSQTLGYPNVVYRCAINTVALAGASTSSTCLKSIDGGLSFVPTGAAPYVTDPNQPGSAGVPGYCDGALGHGATGPDGTVYLPKGFCGQPYLAISQDEGLTWTRVQVSTLGMPVGEDGAQDHEAGVGVDPAGNIYYAWVARDRLPHMTVSRDGGRTWSPPLNLSAPGLREASLAELIVGGVGKIAAVYMGSTNSPGPPFNEFTNCTDDPLRCAGVTPPPTRDYTDATWNAYLVASWNALDANPVFYTASVNDPGDPMVRGTCGVIRCQEVFDFLDVRIGPDGTPWASLVDGCEGDCATGVTKKDNAREGVVGRLWGGPSLWDA